jgi:hypothetical protein
MKMGIAAGVQADRSLKGDRSMAPNQKKCGSNAVISLRSGLH